MAAQLQLQYHTPEEYLELEKNSESKNEYFNGEIIPIAGETTNHNHFFGKSLSENCFLT